MIDLLDAPLRVTWSFHGEKGILSETTAAIVAERLVEAGVFFVTLQDRPLAFAGFSEVVSTLSSGVCRLFLVCDGGGDETAFLEKGLPIDTVFVDARPYLSNGLDHNGLRISVARVRDRGYEVGLLMTPLRSTLMMIPSLIDFCRAEGICRFKLPNVSIFDVDIRSQILCPRDVEPLRALYHGDDAPSTEGVVLEIHDLFLWRILTPGNDGSRSEYGGCQACNSLAHVDSTGNLFPCISWPESLGSLLDHPLTEVWHSPRRLEIRQEIASVPPGCAGCRDYPLCFGGCRGLSRFLGDSVSGERDPLCPSPR